MRFAALLIFAGTMAAAPAAAHEDHEHADEAAAIPMPGAGLRNVAELSSELYEAVVESHGDHLDIYLDRFDTNEPVAGASLTLAIGDGEAKPVEEKAVGTYTIAITPIEPGTGVPITLIVDGEAGGDLLGGTLDVAAEPEVSLGTSLGGWLAMGWRPALGLAALLCAAVFGWRVLRERRRSASSLAGGRAHGATLGTLAMALACVALAAHGPPVAAHEGHDHDERAAAPALIAGGRPMRLPDGSVFVPKPTQRILELRTQIVSESATPDSLRLAGEVVGDPRASAVLQTLQGGRVAGDDGRWPTLGARVRRGQVLLRLTPSGSGGERASTAAEAARVTSDLAQAGTELRRLEGLPGVVSRAEVEAARARVEGLRAQRAALGGPLGAGAEAIVAPIDGVIASIDAQPGVVVAPGDSLISLIDPARLSIEALAFEPIGASGGRVSAITRATVALRDGTTLAAQVEGAGAQLRGGAIPVRLNLAEVAPGLAVGQPVVVFLERSITTPGLPLPVHSLVRLPSGERVVFEKVSAERFVPRTVRVKQVSADRVAVLAGLEPGARVVVRGAALVAQIR